MARIQFKNVGITALSACVPSTISRNIDLKELIGEEDIAKTINSIGIKEKRIAETKTCASDLCIAAAEHLIKENNIDLNSIDLVLFVSQTPDYKIPGTAPYIQNKLGLPKNTACLDLSIGCSGYIYGLSTAFSYANTIGINKILLLVGDTFSKIVNPRDKVNSPLYGDAGTATLIEKGKYPSSYFNLYADGSGNKSIYIPAGQCRVPVSEDSLKEAQDSNGIYRAETELYMNGMEVFNFSLRVVAPSIEDILSFSNRSLNEIDYLVLHQANKFMTDFIVKKLKYNTGKVPYCLDRYGNTSSPSIPLTISSELNNEDLSNKNVLMVGFGAGLSWGTFLGDMTNCNITEVIEYSETL